MVGDCMLKDNIRKRDGLVTVCCPPGDLLAGPPGQTQTYKDNIRKRDGLVTVCCPPGDLLACPPGQTQT
jgi:hypothetical protein